jgi:hypothetical protein
MREKVQLWRNGSIEIINSEEDVRVTEELAQPQAIMNSNNNSNNNNNTMRHTNSNTTNENIGTINSNNQPSLASLESARPADVHANRAAAPNATVPRAEGPVGDAVPLAPNVPVTKKRKRKPKVLAMQKSAETEKKFERHDLKKKEVTLKKKQKRDQIRYVRFLLLVVLILSRSQTHLIGTIGEAVEIGQSTVSVPQYIPDTLGNYYFPSCLFDEIPNMKNNRYAFILISRLRLSHLKGGEQADLLLLRS